MRKRFLSSIAGALLIPCIAAGCAAVTETGKGLAGVSTKVLEDNRENAFRKTYPLDQAKCKEMVEELLADIKAYIYARSDKKKMLAFYVSESDTTPVGIFFVRKITARTDVLVSSPSRYAKEVIADRIGAWFEKKQRKADKGKQ